jgi:endonuclease YncB( thermonuclease family)
MRRPRRIFRSSTPRTRRGRATLGLYAGLLALAAGAALLLSGLFTFGVFDGFDAAPPPPGRLEAASAQIAVVDGSTLRLRERVVRLLGIETPDRGQTCRQPNGGGFDCAAASTEALVALVRRGQVACELRGQDGMGRALAVCEASGTELNRALVAGGWARAGRELPGLKHEELLARTEGRGLWGTTGAVTW